MKGSGAGSAGVSAGAVRQWPQWRAPAVLRAAQPAVLWLLVACVVALAGLPLDWQTRVRVVAAASVLAPLAALVAVLAAARALPRAYAGPWAVIGVAAGAAAIAQFAAWADPAGGAAPVPLLQFVWLGLFGGALGWMLQLRADGRAAEIGLDSALVIGAATVVALRWMPGTSEALQAPRGALHLISLAGVPIAACCAVFFAAVLLLVRARTPGSPVAAGMALAGAAFLVALLEPDLLRGLALAGRSAAAPLSPQLLGLAGALGWVGVATAGYYAERFAVTLDDAPGADRLRMIVAPGAALAMGAVALDAVVGEPLAAATALALGGVGIVLAVRLTHLLRATRTQSAERLELAQSRALVDVSRALSATTDVQETLDLVTTWAVSLLDGRAATIELLTADGAQLEFRAVHGLPAEVMRARFPRAGSCTAWVDDAAGPIATPDARTAAYLDSPVFRHTAHAPVAAAPLRYRDQLLGALTCVGRQPFRPADLELLAALADQAAVAMENARLFQQVHQLSMTDPLTGLPNRRQLERDLAREFAAARRGRTLFAVMLDMNNFKEYNDRYGHLAGDEALRLFGVALAAETRAMNTAARYGGDEFIVLLADTTQSGVQVFLERLRQRFPGPHATRGEQDLSFATGIAEYHPGMSAPEELIAAADRALYESKDRRPQPVPAAV